MSKIGFGYGSEWHLMRYLARHRDRLDEAICKDCSVDSIHWYDFPFSNDPKWRDVEWKGLDFLPTQHKARKEWERRWPQRGNVPNWDALAKIKCNGAQEWLLVEAKGHIGEIASACGAKSKKSRIQIEDLFRDVKESLGVSREANWLKPYYQYCNRVAALQLMNMHGAPARLLLIYYTGDWVGRSSRKCPKTPDGWKQALAKQDEHVALPNRHPLKGRIHKLFLDVGGS